MDRPLQNLSRMKYPGRLIILGEDKSGEQYIVIYAITGRSASSQARKLEHKENMVLTKPTDPEIVKKGNIDLLIYPAIVIYSRLVVSNGKQTLDILSQPGQSPGEILKKSLEKWDYEPDLPIFTPRISGCILSGQASLSIIKRGEQGSSIRFFYDVPFKAGQGKMIATYSGENKDPLKPFPGRPLDVELEEKNPKKMSEAVYEALKPAQGQDDYRVAVACVFAKKSDLSCYRLFVINRQKGK